ncbi:MAG: polysaccharide biosynthesis tyrosine autokinase [Pyrinomonadaceae bacterium]|nr:polysaccharide biosynthesis tyrosine autokinase [Pyrinomonadaceae bacterium]
MKESREIIKQPAQAEIERPFDSPPVTPTGRYAMYRGENARVESPLFEYWRAVRKRLWLVIGVTVLLTTLAAIYMARKPNVYMASAVVQVDMEQANPDLITSDRRIPGGASDPAYFNTQLQLLSSDTLLRNVVKRLSLDSNEEFQKAKNEGNVSSLRAMLQAIGLASSDDSDSKDGIEDAGYSSNSELVTSEEIAEAVRLAPYVTLINRSLSVDPVRESRATVKDTRLIAVSFRHTDPDLAAYVVNGIAEVYTSSNQEKRTGTNRKTNSFLQERIANLEGEIKAGETRLVNLKARAGILEKDDNVTIVIERLSGLNKQLLDSEESRKEAESQYNAVKNSPERINALVEERMAQYIADRETAIRRLENETRKEIGQLKAQRKKLLVEYVEAAPEIEEIDKQIETLDEEIGKVKQKNEEGLEAYRKRTAKTIVSNLRTRYLQARDQENKVRSAFNSQYNEAQGENQSAVAIRLLEQDIETKRGFLENLTKKQKENDVVAAGTKNNISIAEIAIPPERPISPRRVTTVGAAMLLSLLFGAGLALFLEYLDDSIKTTEEVEDYLGLPALAAIPTIDSMPKRRLLLVGGTQEEEGDGGTELLISKDSRSSMSEAYRQLRTSILLSTAGHPPNSLLITSSLPAEGKTTTAINTAISLAQTSAKVLVVDGDLRRPRLHRVFNLSNGEGLSTLLSNEIERDEILDIVQHDEESNLYLLPAGPVPPNPAELIGSEQMRELLDVLEGEFTHVVLDSPPIASFTDGVLMASLVDGVILVVQSGKSSRQVVQRARQLIMDIGAKIFGVVLNNVNLKSQDGSYYYQSYYHRGSYNYDETE